MTHECLCILRFSNLCCSIAVILWSGLSEIILSKSSDTRSLKAECQKYQEVPIARTKASQTLHVCELWSCDLLSKFNCHYGIRPRQVFGCPLNGTCNPSWVVKSIEHSSIFLWNYVVCEDVSQVCVSSHPSHFLPAQVVFCQSKSYRSEVISSERRKEKYIFHGKRKYIDWAAGKYQIKESGPAWDKCLPSLCLMRLCNSSENLVE